MENQADQIAEEHSVHEPEETPSASGEVVARNRGFRRVFGFLGSWTFWWRLGVGALFLGAGVLIGLGIAWFMEDNRDSEHDRGRGGDSFAVPVDPSAQWFGEQGFSRPWQRFPFPPKGFKVVPDGRSFPGQGGGWERDDRMREWFERRGEWFEKEGPGVKDFFEEEGIYIPYEALEILEGVVEKVEHLIERVAEYLEEGRFGPRVDGSGESDDKGFWDRDDDGSGEKDREYSSHGDYRRDDENSSERAGALWDDDGDGPLAGFRFPFGEILPDLAFLEDCELDFQSLPSIIEDLQDLDGEDAEDEEEGSLGDGEELEGFFQQIEELFDEVCDPPADGDSSG